MFGIGSSELLVILVVALLVLGPSHLPKIAKTLGKAMGEFRRVSSDFQRTLNLEAEKEDHEERKRQAEKTFFPEDTTAQSGAAKEAHPDSDPGKAADAVRAEIRTPDTEASPPPAAETAEAGSAAPATNEDSPRQPKEKA